MPTPLWRNRDFMLLQAGQLFSTFGGTVSRIAYPLLTLAVTHSAAKVGYVGAVEFVPFVVFALPAGVAADRFDRRALMIVSDAAGAASLAALAALVLTHTVTFWWILVIALVDSTAGVFFRAGNSGAFRAVVPESQLADASRWRRRAARLSCWPRLLSGARSSASPGRCRSSPTRSPTRSRRSRCC